MKFLTILFILTLLFSCQFTSKSAEDNHISFTDTAPFKTFDFENLDQDSISNIQFKTYNLKKADVSLKSGKASVYIADINDNNLFNDKEDAIVISMFGAEKPHNLHIANKANQPTYFSLNNEVFSISNIKMHAHQYSGEITLTNLPLNEVPRFNRFFDEIPNVGFSAINGGMNYQLNSFKNNNKLVFLEFWTSWCSPCIQALPTLKKIHDTYGDNIDVISINCDKTLSEDVLEIIETHNMNWIQGYINDDLKEQVSFEMFPRGYLFNEKGELLKFDASPYQVLNYLEELSH